MEREHLLSYLRLCVVVFKGGTTYTVHMNDTILDAAQNRDYGPARAKKGSKGNPNRPETSSQNLSVSCRFNR